MEKQMKWVSPIITLAYCQVGKGRREEKRRGGEREERVKERERKNREFQKIYRAKASKETNASQGKHT
jgi:hypothetical protein